MVEVIFLLDFVSQVGSFVFSEENLVEKQDIDVGQSIDINLNSKDIILKIDEVIRNVIGDDEIDGDVNKVKLEKINNL